MPYRYRCPYCSEKDACTLQCADEVDAIIRNEDPLTVAAVIMEPVQNSAGSITPPPGYFERIREICDEHGVLLVADEVICGFGRVGDWFGSTRYGIEPDMMTMAKGLTSAYAPLGARRQPEGDRAVLREPTTMFLHGITFGGHPLVRDRAREPRVFERETSSATCSGTRTSSARSSSSQPTIRWWATCAATGSTRSSS